MTNFLKTTNGQTYINVAFIEHVEVRGDIAYVYSTERRPYSEKCVAYEVDVHVWQRYYEAHQ